LSTISSELIFEEYFMEIQSADENKKVVKPEEEGYFQYAQRSFYKILELKHLWWWGIFISAGVQLGYNLPDQAQTDKITENYNLNSEQYLQFAKEYAALILGGLAVLVFLIILYWLFSAVARSGMLRALDILEGTTRRVSSKNIWYWGKERYKAVLLMDIIIQGMILLLFFVMLLPIVYMYINQKTGGMLAISFLMIMILVPISLLAGFIRNIAVVRISLVGQNTWKAIEQSYQVFLKRKTESAKIILMVMLIDFVKSAVMVLAALIIMVAFFGAHALLVDGDMKSAYVVGGFFGLILLIILLFVGAIGSLWQMDLWLWWAKKNGAIKVEELAEERAAKELNIQKVEAFSGAGSFPGQDS
jgi:hypothetical protein